MVIKKFCRMKPLNYNMYKETYMKKNRANEILSYMQTSGSTGVSLNDLAGQFGVSRRQIRNYISQINEKAGKEVLAVTEGTCILNPAYAEIKESRDFSSDERISIIVSSLLFADGPKDLYDLAEELFVSDATIESDLKKIRRKLKPFHLELNNEAGNLTITGSEKDKRSLASYMITNTHYKGFRIENTNQFMDEDYQIELVKENLIRIFNESSFIYNDYSLNNIILHLIIIIDRLRNHYYIEETQIGLAVNETEEKATDQIVAFLEDTFDIEVAPAERSVISNLLTGNLVTMDYRMINRDNVSSYVSPQTVKLVDYILERITDYYLLDPFDDVFFARFCLHVDNLLKRLKVNHSIHNPMLMEIKLTYPLIFDIAAYAAALIEEQTGFKPNQDEISLIALHIGSFMESSDSNRNKVSAIYVYSDYHQFYQHNVSELQKKFEKELNILYTISHYDYEQEQMNPDLIISEVPLSNAVLVSPFITYEQTERIHDRIRQLAKKNESDHFIRSLKDLFTEDLFFTDIYGADEFEVLRRLTDKLADKNLFDDTYAESVLNRERISSTCFVKRVAIPHALGHNVNRSFISVVTYDRKQVWGNDAVTLLVLFGISYVDRKNFRFVFNHIVELLSKEANINAFSKCRSYEEIMDTLNQIMIPEKE